MAMTSPLRPSVSEWWRLPFGPQYRRFWLRELPILLLCMASTTLLFWLTPLDLEVSRRFFAPGNDLHWPLTQKNPWIFINRQGDEVLALILIVGSLFTLAAGVISARWKLFRRYAVFVLLSTILGPGLMVNAVFKEHLGRPRPAQILEFHGSHAYVPPLKMGPIGGNSSFPSGHASIAFSYVVFWFILRRRHPRLAVVAFVVACALGGGMGFARVAGGAHFLSDILWAGYLSFLGALISDHVVLRSQDNDEKL